MTPLEPDFTQLVDLAAERLGGQALLASDEFFAPKENLLQPGRGEFKPGLYTDHGKWMDGWESRRKRGPGNDWCIIRLGLPGVIEGVNIDTNHFLGNHPPHASVDATDLPGDPGPGDIPESSWTEIVSKVSLEPGAENLFPATTEGRWTHARLNIYPDGGVARLRLFGRVTPDWGSFGPGETIDLAAIANGGLPVACSDMFFSAMQNLIMPGPPVDMGDGWETRRRRGPGNDWIVVRLGRPGTIRRIVVDTTHFKGNYPDRCSLDGCRAESAGGAPFDAEAAAWTEIMPETKLSADRLHEFRGEITAGGPWSHVRLNIYPDGGVARLRLYGDPVEGGP